MRIIGVIGNTRGTLGYRALRPPEHRGNEAVAHRILVVLGEGGHSAELLRLVPELRSAGDVTFLATTNDVLAEAWVPEEDVLDRVRRPRHKESTRVGTVADLIRCVIGCFVVAWRRKPTVIVSSGPGVGAVMCWVGWLAGSRIVFVETIARVTGLSMAGRLTRPIADRFFVQWPQAQDQAPGAIYAGQLM